jgi:hypothetical protein
MLAQDNRARKDRLPNYVRDVSTSSRLFCPYGADVKAGDRVYVYDEKTAHDRRQRERRVEVTAVKVFRSNGRVVTLDLEKITLTELARIATESELSMEALLEHHAGASTYDPKRPPVVVYFKPCDEDDTIGAQFRPRYKRQPRWKRLVNSLSSWSGRMFAR